MSYFFMGRNSILLKVNFNKYIITYTYISISARSDINAADTDGWTPLHCAASCNNLSMAKFLVENGACIFATTISDGETAADKCEELDEGYLPCFDYLSGIQVSDYLIDRFISI